MAVSVFIALAQAVQALLEADPPVADQVLRDRTRVLPKDFASQVCIKLDKTQGQRGGTFGSPTDWGTLFELECSARCAADVLPTEAVDPIVMAVFERLAGSGPDLDLDVEDVLPDPRIEWDLGEGETRVVTATFSVRIVHRTQATQLVAWSA